MSSEKESDSAAGLIDKLRAGIERSILKNANDLVRVEYKDRQPLPIDFLKRVYESVDFGAVEKRMAVKIEEMLADKIVNQMAAEISTDVKKILSVPERREELRAIARESMERIISAGECDGS